MIDTVDAHLAPEIEGSEVLVGDTIMRNAEDRRRVATEVLAFARGLVRR
jgi:hypothetical protein